MSKAPTKQDDPEQSARFAALVKELGAEEEPKDFKEKLRAIAAAPRNEPQPKRRKKGSR